MKRVWVTGGTGFIGANLVRRLLREGHEVHLLVQPQFTRWRIADLEAQVRLHRLSLLDAPALRQLAQETRPQWIFHLAAYGSSSWQTELPQIVETNFLATLQLVQACGEVGFEAFINTGSSSEYGLKDHPPSEREILEPNSYYAVTKASATLFCQYTAQSRQWHIPTLRLYSVFGPYEGPKRFLPTLIMHGLEGRLPPLVNPQTARDFIYIDDVCEAYLQVAQASDLPRGAIYNVGSGRQVTLAEAVTLARQLLQIPMAPQWGTMAQRGWDSSIWVSDPRKIQQELGWQSHFSFEQGLEAMISWFRTHPELHHHYQTA